MARRSWGIGTALLVATACTSQSTGSSGTGSASGQLALGQSKQAQVLRGRAVVLQTACGDCHGGGNNPAAKGWLAGMTSPEQELPIGELKQRPRNLTPDVATGTGPYSERQIFNALRYGLRPKTTPDVDITSSRPGQGNFPANPDYLSPAMPWAAWRHLPDQDLWAIAAYLKNGLAPVTNLVQPSDMAPDKWASTVTVERIGSYPAFPHPTANETSVTDPQVLRGRAVVVQKDCGGCHGGGPNPAAKGYLAGMTASDQEFVIGPFKTRPRNLTPDNTTGMGRFTERQIFNALRFGLRPGETPDVEITSTTPGVGNFPARPKYLAPPMPWGSWRHSSDEDLQAIAAYLKRGVKPVANKVEDSEGPPDFWAGSYTVDKIGPYPALPFPTVNERALR